MVFALEIAHNAIRLSSGRVGTTQAVFPWGIDCQNGAGIFISKKWDPQKSAPSPSQKHLKWASASGPLFSNRTSTWELPGSPGALASLVHDRNGIRNPTLMQARFLGIRWSDLFIFLPPSPMPNISEPLQMNLRFLASLSPILSISCLNSSLCFHLIGHLDDYKKTICEKLKNLFWHVIEKTHISHQIYSCRLGTVPASWLCWSHWSWDGACFGNQAWFTAGPSGETGFTNDHDIIWK